MLLPVAMTSLFISPEQEARGGYSYSTRRTVRDRGQDS